jgi:hypothetical protein
VGKIQANVEKQGGQKCGRDAKNNVQKIGLYYQQKGTKKFFRLLKRKFFTIERYIIILKGEGGG